MLAINSGGDFCKAINFGFEEKASLTCVAGLEVGELYKVPGHETIGLGIYDGFDLVPVEAIYPTYRDLAEFFCVPLVEAFSID